MRRRGVVRFALFVGGALVWLSPGVPAAERPGAEPKKVNLVGQDLSAWREDMGQWMIVGQVKMDPANPKMLSTSPGICVLVNGPTGRTGNLLSKFEHGDVEAHVEFMVPEGSNSGVYFQARYEIQILDSWKVEHPKYGDCGGIYERWDEKANRGYEGTAPRVNASKAPGEWQTFDVVFRAPRFDANGKKIENARFIRVVHNGLSIQKNVEVDGPTRASMEIPEAATNPIMLQGDHGPVAYRNIYWRPLREIIER